MIDLSSTVISLQNHNNIDCLLQSIDGSGGGHGSAAAAAAAAAAATTDHHPPMPNIIISSNSYQQHHQQQQQSSLINGSEPSPYYEQQLQHQHQQQQQQQQQHVSINSTPHLIGAGCAGINGSSDDANKAFDDVVFDILRVDPDDLAGQLTLIDLPLFKAIEPDELISCKWMSRDKLVRAPNIVHFTRRFNQTTFWCQKEILNCLRIEKRGKMLTHFIKMAKRLYELHSFNSLMAIVVALKSAPIFRLKKTWTQHVSKRDTAQFDRLADLMFDTSDNKRKIRDIHMNCKLPCIPFLGLFLTDLIHIDIAHPHNSFDNPQRRNQMNNICRLISEYQQSNYQDLTSIGCSCVFVESSAAAVAEGGVANGGGMAANVSLSVQPWETPTGDCGGGGDVCTTSNCSCLVHHGRGYGAGLINSDGTIYISEITYVKNYLNSFLYIEELQKFKEDENYRDSLQLEPDNPPLGQQQQQLHFQPGTPSSNEPLKSKLSANEFNTCSSSPATKFFMVTAANPVRLNKHPLASYASVVDSTSHGAHGVNNNNNMIMNNNNNGNKLACNGETGAQTHRKTLSLATSLFNNNNNSHHTVTNQAWVNILREAETKNKNH